MTAELIKGFFRVLGLLVLIALYCMMAALSNADAAAFEIGAPAESKFSCAIAKSAYGSPGFDEPIKRLRAFRDKVLGGSDMGRCLVRVYYRLSGSLAPYLDGDGLSGCTLKWTIRAFLWLVKYLEPIGLGGGLLLIAFVPGIRGTRSIKASPFSPRGSHPAGS
jgi:hypothetical protein